MAEYKLNCIDDTLLWRYIEGYTDEAETNSVQAHLIACEKCFSVFVSVMHTERNPLTDREIAEVNKILSSDREKVIADFLQQNAPAVSQSAPRVNAWQNLRDWASQHFGLRAVLGMVAALAVMVVAWQGVRFMSQPAIDDTLYIFDDRAPYLPSTLRSAGPDSGLPVWQETLNSAIQNQYGLREYEAALQSFESIETATANLPADSAQKEIPARLRDVYFYKGLSHLALSRSQTRKLSDSLRADHAERAVRSLQIADSLVKAHTLPNPDREAYYLGLALALAGQEQQALAKLDQVSSTSSFFDDSERLKKAWIAK